MTSVARPGSAGRTVPASRPRDDRQPRRRKEQRSDIWTNLLRQTREAQARSRTQAVQHRELLVCGGSPDDQRAFVQSLARPPPPAPPSRNRDQRPQKPKGEVKLSNRYAYGYGHVTLYSPPQQTAGLLGSGAEEVAGLEVHTLPEPDLAYEVTLRRLLEPKGGKEEGAEDVVDGFAGSDGEVKEERRPAVSLLLSWKEPWRFMSLLRRWLQLLARALLPSESPDEDSLLEVLKEHKLALTVVVQHVEAQEGLEREGYREESFDYISQCLRTSILPLSAALVYTSSNPPPQQPGSALSEVQKVLYTSLSLDLGPLSPAPAKSSTTAKREDLVPKHNVVDRMAIVVPSGWDSAGKIRLLSETFSPESVLQAWMTDLNTPQQSPAPEAGESTIQEPNVEKQANGGAERHDAEQEVYATSDAGEEDPDLAARPLSPTKQTTSAIATYEQAILDPNAHKAPKSPQIEVTTKPDQHFLAEMRSHLQTLEAEDAEKAKRHPGDRVSTTAGSGQGGGRMIGLPTGEQTGALNGLGDVSFNVGGVSYNTVSAEAAIERLKRPQPSGLDSPASASTPRSTSTSAPAPAIAAAAAPASSSSPRTTTPRQPRREDREVSAGTPQTQTTSTGSKGKGEDLPLDQLEAYFHSLMKKSGAGAGGAGGSGANTPSKAPTQQR